MCLLDMRILSTVSAEFPVFVGHGRRQAKDLCSPLLYSVRPLLFHKIGV